MHDQIKLYFNKGERRKIQLDVYSCKNEPFIILNASYSVVDLSLIHISEPTRH